MGDTLVLKCNFVIGKDQLYSVKWYKDNMEFYRLELLVISNIVKNSFHPQIYP